MSTQDDVRKRGAVRETDEQKFDEVAVICLVNCKRMVTSVLKDLDLAGTPLQYKALDLSRTEQVDLWLVGSIYRMCSLSHLQDRRPTQRMILSRLTGSSSC
jgi:hypothetical protein